MHADHALCFEYALKHGRKRSPLSIRRMSQGSDWSVPRVHRSSPRNSGRIERTIDCRARDAAGYKPWQFDVIDDNPRRYSLISSQGWLRPGMAPGATWPRDLRAVHGSAPISGLAHPLALLLAACLCSSTSGTSTGCAHPQGNAGISTTVSGPQTRKRRPGDAKALWPLQYPDCDALTIQAGDKG
jgi:hypothetical protein